MFKVEFEDYSAQCIHMKVTDLATSFPFHLSMVYAFSGLHERIELWTQLLKIAGNTNGPWIICEDFNCVLSPAERLGGQTSVAEMDDFQHCIYGCALVDSPAVGAFFTWNNKQEPTARVYSRLDRVLVNNEWVSQTNIYAHFLPEGDFDHTPCVMKRQRVPSNIVKPFKYFNMWGKSDLFLPNLAVWWNIRYQGTKMFILTTKLKRLKHHLRLFNRDHFSNIETSSCLALKNLEFIQEQLSKDPSNVEWLHKEHVALVEYRELQSACESNLRHIQNRVILIKDMNGVECIEPQDVQNAFLQYYTHLLGTSTKTVPVNTKIIQRGVVCTSMHWDILLKHGTKMEIKEVIFSIPDNNRKMLKQLNATVLTLIPKCKLPASVTQFGPIACCNVLYKAISKLLSARLGAMLPDLVSLNQGGFVQGRSIVENILIYQDLVRMYNRQSFSPRCVFKIDLMKAYDSVSWSFVEEMLVALKFPAHFRDLVMLCVTTASFSISLNCEMFGFFPGRRGLRQGDPISPLLFTLCMEYLSRILECDVDKLPFHFHPLCKQLKLTHLMFVDDLLMLCKGDSPSILLLLRAFSAFSIASGLQMNSMKSCAYFNGTSEQLKSEILSVSGFIEGHLPFKYLGVPITAGRLRNKDCTALIDKIVDRIRSLDAICGNFLWEGSSEYSRVPLLAWDNVCVSKEKGSLGLRNGHVWNMDVLSKVVWWLAVKADKLWVKWVHNIYLKRTHLSEYVPAGDIGWHWKQIYNVIHNIKDGFDGDHWTVGNGVFSTSSCYEFMRAHKEKVEWHRSCSGLISALMINAAIARNLLKLQSICSVIVIMQMQFGLKLKASWARINGILMRPEWVVKQIQTVIKERLSNLVPFPLRIRDKEWLAKVDLH
ncbi:uncharacterized protein LOC141588497 [Silene latifolia]|uniref:uncharacterized protein LOC141588497 n=1 Tax=Silene latifolia TaxID=37657 RepID=UPI003D77109A